MDKEPDRTDEGGDDLRSEVMAFLSARRTDSKQNPAGVVAFAQLPRWSLLAEAFEGWLEGQKGGEELVSAFRFLRECHPVPSKPADVAELNRRLLLDEAGVPRSTGWRKGAVEDPPSGDSGYVRRFVFRAADLVFEPLNSFESVLYRTFVGNTVFTTATSPNRWS